MIKHDQKKAESQKGIDWASNQLLDMIFETMNLHRAHDKSLQNCSSNKTCPTKFQQATSKIFSNNPASSTNKKH